MSKKEKRDWQEDAAAKIASCSRNTKHNIIPVNACVGSGKTDVASWAFGDFIKLHRSEKTIQMFVTPRIRLCAQQTDEISRYIEEELGLKAGIDFDMIRKDCTQHDLNLSLGGFGSKHAILVVCDESLWGVESDGSEKRWKSWMKFFKKRLKEGYLLGNVVLDEAHNFTANREKIFGDSEVFVSKEMVNEAEEEDM